MKTYLCLDGGGSKLFGLLFDEAFHLLGSGMSGGVNPTQNAPELIWQHIRDCLQQLFASHVPDGIDMVFFTAPVAQDELLREIRQILPVQNAAYVSEPRASLLAGCLRDHGYVALAGTGSDVFLLDPAENLPPAERICGSWGPILGDQGSGAWIGLTALRASIRAADGWDEPTTLTGRIRQAWQVNSTSEMADMIYRHPAPFSKIAALTRLVAAAAQDGDAVALRILTEAGKRMASQANSLIARGHEDRGIKEVLMAGGAWKSHPAMREAFAKELTGGMIPVAPLFEPASAGVVLVARAQGLDAAQTENMMRTNFPLCVWHA